MPLGFLEYCFLGCSSGNAATMVWGSPSPMAGPQVSVPIHSLAFKSPQPGCQALEMIRALQWSALPLAFNLPS